MSECGCRDGVLWPMATDSDNSHDWIERCDECQLYASDDAAAYALSEQLGRKVQWGWLSSLQRYAPYIDLEAMDPTEEAVVNIRNAIRVIAPIWESMHRFGHTGADDVAGAQAELEQAVRFLTGEEEPS